MLFEIDLSITADVKLQNPLFATLKVMITPIIILTLLCLPLAIAYLIAKSQGKPLALAKYACWGLGIAFIFFAIGHFVKTAGMVEMLPAWVPARQLLVYATGIAEFIVGLMLFFPKYQKLAATLAIILLVLFFPANVYAALNRVGLGGHQWGPVYLWIRTPLQLILLSWAYFLCIKQNK